MTGKSSLIFVVGFGLIMGYISLNLHEGGKEAEGNSSLYYERTMLHNVATAGAHLGLAKVYEDTTWGLNGETIEHTLSGAEIPATYVVQRILAPTGGTMIRSVATYHVPGLDGEPFESTVDVYLPYQQSMSFSMYAWMTNSESINGVPVDWVTGDTVGGRVHTNDKINVNGDPDFKGKVTAVNGFNDDPGSGTNQGIYEQGWESGVAHIDFPSDLSQLISASQDAVNGGRYFDSSSVWISLDGGNSGVHGDGKALVRLTPSGPVIDTVLLNGGSNGVILGRDSVHVQGVLDGRLTVASLGDIFVENNITYELDPRIDPASTDLLGLVADRRVVVTKNAPDNCTINAAIFSRDSSFAVDSCTVGPPRGTLTILGSIIQDTRGVFGTLSTGYSRNLLYDQRLANPTVRPPFFPTFVPSTLPITGWWESPITQGHYSDPHHHD